MVTIKILSLLLGLIFQLTSFTINTSLCINHINLFNEIKLYRAIELWGEGFDFFDMKRWGDGISRKTFSEGGNFQGVLGTNIKPTDNNNWKIVTPAKETDFNTLLE
ncbi:RagB/SusD family nutrient uptake outer membrane protein [Sphingobacterium thalpophilum]|uniref:RagB/SusD family nutrient uptake outer membrane protein n=1 Tax=Sphingobacterium thalpophilum TaxID=259 RepID=UPI003C730723